MRARANRKPSRRNDPEGMRRRVLDAAFGMFQTRGYNGTSMQDLTRAIEVTGGALHHHFPTKRSIALAVFAERVAQAARKNPQTEVQLRADKTVPYGRVAELIGAVQKAGLNRIGFVAEPAPAEGQKP